MTDGSDEDPTTCHNYNCSATGRVQCPSGDYCMWDYCNVCNSQNYSSCADGSDQLPSACHLKALSNCSTYWKYYDGYPGYPSTNSSTNSSTPGDSEGAPPVVEAVAYGGASGAGAAAGPTAGSGGEQVTGGPGGDETEAVVTSRGLLAAPVLRRNRQKFFRTHNHRKMF